MRRIVFSGLALVALVALYASLWRPETPAPADPVPSKRYEESDSPTVQNPGREKPSAAIGAFHESAAVLFEQLPRLSAPPRTGVVSASTALGKVFHALKLDPALVAEGEVFYKECALSPELFTAVRAVCLKDLRYWSAKVPAHYSETEMPANVLRLADVLPSPR